MTAWTPAETDRLRELAALEYPAWLIGKILGREGGATGSKAYRSKIPLNGSPEITAIMEYRGVIHSEDCGGAIGVRYFPAHRSGGSFNAGFVDALISVGCLIEDRGGWIVAARV